MERSAGLRGDRLLAVVDSDRALDGLQRYFGTGHYENTKPFDGAYFERLAGGGDRPETANRIAADDLVAVGALSVQVPIAVASRLLDSELGDQIGRLLAQIPTDIDLADDEAEAVVTPRSPADQAWHLLDNETAVGWVIAGKLLARKRPRLLPVYDRVVRCALGWGRLFWMPLHAELRADGARLHHALTALRSDAGLPDEISALRTLDVVLWMRHRQEHTTPCRGQDLSSLDASLRSVAAERPVADVATTGEG